MEVAQIGYKVIEFPDKIKEDIFQGQTKSDWSAIYIQLNPQHAIRYIYNKYETYTKVSLVKFTFTKSITFIVINNDIISNAQITSNEKSSFIKSYLAIHNQIQLNNQEPLMFQLGKRSICLIINDNDGDLEIVVPHSIMQYSDCYEMETLITFIRHPSIVFRTIQIIVGESEQEPQQDKRDSIHQLDIDIFGDKSKFVK